MKDQGTSSGMEKKAQSRIIEQTHKGLGEGALLLRTTGLRGGTCDKWSQTTELCWCDCIDLTGSGLTLVGYGSTFERISLT
jgi:hypothetical protein